MQNVSKKAFWNDRIFSIVTGVYFSAVLCLMIFAQDKLSFAYSQPYLFKNTLLLPIALGLIGIAVCLRKWVRWHPAHSRWNVFLAVCFPLLLLLQFVFVRSVWYQPGFDVVNVYTNAELIAEGSLPLGEYFRLCPNNAPITVLLAAPLWIAIKLGLAVPYAVLPYSGAIMANLAVLFSVLCVDKITHSRFACISALLLGTVWIAFSMLITVPYTDIFAILFPVLALYLFLSNLRTLPKWFFISLVSFFGASIKPTVMIFFIALVLISAIKALTAAKWTWPNIRHFAILGLVIVLGALPGTIWKDQSTAQLAGSANPQQQLSETHYLMMGMNGETYGGHSPADVKFSESYTNLADRRKANLQQAWERFSARSFTENTYFFAVKSYKAFFDGMIAATKSFLVLAVPQRTDALSTFLRRVVYIKGDLHPVLVTVEQAIWLCILLLCVFAMFTKSRHQKITAVLSLTLLGLAAYLLLFEVWPRYIFLYAPFFVIQASLGLDHLCAKVLRLTPRRSRFSQPSQP